MNVPLFHNLRSGDEDSGDGAARAGLINEDIGDEVDDEKPELPEHTAEVPPRVASLGSYNDMGEFF